MPAFPAARASRALMVLALAICAAGAAHAQLLEQVEVVRRGDLAVIQARFATTVRYVRHAPPDYGKLVRIEIEVTGPVDVANPDMRVTRRHPANAIIPSFLLVYSPTTRGITVEFREDVSFKVGGGADGRTIEIRLPIRGAARPAPVDKPAVPPPAAALPQPPAAARAEGKPAQAPPAPAGKEAVPEGVAAMTPADVEKEAVRALAAAKAALGRGDLVAAIESLNRVLDLPPTRASQEAQELIGVARERDGQLDKARVEYQLYLKLHPDGPGAERVRARLAGLGAKREEASRAPRVARTERSSYGSVSTYYYSGNTKYDASLQPRQPTLPADQISLTARDQSALVTNVDATTRVRMGSWEHRLNFRDTFTANFLAGEEDENRLNALYYEVMNRERDLVARAGRQPSPGVGVLGRFDGAWARMAFAPGWRAGLVAGKAVEFYPAPSKRFVGASLDVGPFSRAWSGNVFALEQRVEGIRDRRAAGAELRYLDPVANGFALFDYDVARREVNTVLVQANWNLTPAASANLLVDHRRAPTLQLSNALFAHPGVISIRELVNAGASIEALWREAEAMTPVSDLYSLGLTYRFSPRWQLGGDVKLQKVSGTDAAGALPAAPGTGNIWVYTVQGIGTSLWAKTDVAVASASVLRGALFDGWTLTGSYVLVVRDAWRLEAQLRYYRQTDANGMRLSRFTPTAKIGYRVRENFTLEAEAGVERSDSRSPFQADLTNRRFYILGFRWDFY